MNIGDTIMSHVEWDIEVKYKLMESFFTCWSESTTKGETFGQVPSTIRAPMNPLDIYSFTFRLGVVEL
jgi:hypothetical protein